MSKPLIVQVKETDRRTQILRLNHLSVQGLETMFDSRRKLFCQHVSQTGHGLVHEGTSHRYTLISLLGLRRLEAAGFESPISVTETLDHLLEDTAWVQNLGDLGLLMWLCAQAAPDRVHEIDSAFRLKDALARFPEARQRRTMELSWFLSGLAHWRLACPNAPSQIRDLAMESYRLLKSNQGEYGLFSHLADKKGFSGLMRGRIGSFADQIYPVYALAKFSQAWGLSKASERALDCALTLCELQGPLGQWWWHYDAVTRRVLERYPVYSVHQDGMAPMALFALGEAVESDFSPWIFKGLQWIYGDNELEEDLCDSSAKMIWRSIHRKDYKKHWDAALALLAAREDGDNHTDLAVLRECRPYHLGWLLYAWADFAREPGEPRL
jgi:hypothetical protein